MNASQYKDYVLMLFVKYMSDKYLRQKNPPYLAGSYWITDLSAEGEICEVPVGELATKGL